MPLNFLVIILISACLALSIHLVMSFKLTIAVAGIVGILVFISQLFVKDKKRFWFVIFILVLPLGASKILGSREAMLSVLSKSGVPGGASPAPVIFFSDIILLILIIIWATRLAFQKEKVFLPKPAIFLAAFIFWAGLSFINTVNFSYSGFELLRLINFFLIYIFIANNIKSKKDVKTLVVCLAIGVLLQGIVCTLQYKFQTSVSITGFNYLTEVVEDKPQYGTIFYGEGDETIRGSGTVGSFNVQAMYFELLMPLLLCMAILFRKNLKGILFAAAFISGSIGLLFTFSRGGLVGAIVGCTALFIIYTQKNLISKHVFVTLLLLVSVCFSGLFGRISDFMNTRKGVFQNRIEMSKVGVEMVKDSPLLGFGLNTSVIHLPKYDHKDVTIGYPVHNYYLIVASEVGLVGLALLLLFYFKTAKIIINIIRSRNIYMAAVSIGMLTGFIGVAIHMGWDPLSSEVIQTILFIFAGTAVAMKKMIEEEDVPLNEEVPERIV